MNQAFPEGAASPAEPTPVATRATPADLPAIAALFDDYRAFYGMPHEPARATRFLEQNLASGRALLFACRSGDELAGFAQVYPTWCSLEMAPVFILHDVFTAAHRRARGVATALLAAVTREAVQHGAIRVDLMTATGNRTAQRLYESLGWVRESAFHAYSRPSEIPMEASA